MVMHRLYLTQTWLPLVTIGFGALTVKDARGPLFTGADLCVIIRQ